MAATPTWQSIESAFHEALEVEPASRAEFLHRRCSGDATLRQEVEKLLSGHSAADASFITPPEVAPPLPTQIGRYRIVRLLATGGMGAVYEAEGDSPRRTVAVKVLHSGLASPGTLRRFAQESEVLARLRHSGIAQVYEAGVFNNSPFFALEFIDGALPISDYSRSRPLNEVLALFLRVCDAVQHGHQRGVIHRDLKPGNILVDRSGNPKVIDFGIARAADSQADSMHTSAGQLIGTIAYMSPEQCAGDPSSLDTRTDVYSLGVVLYELLCGCTPFDAAQRPLLEVARAIREETPPRPGDHNRHVRGDLETIILTAMERDRERRYQSVAEMSGDLRRYLASQTITARPATVIYQLRMFARRNRALAAGAAVAALGLILGVAGTTWQAIRATDERDRARLAQKAADAEADTSRRIAAVLQNSIASLDARDADAEGLSRAAVLNTSADAIARELRDKPLVQAALFERLSDAYFAVGLRESQRAMLESACRLLDTDGSVPADLARVRMKLGGTLKVMRSHDEAEVQLRKVINAGDDPLIAESRISARIHLFELLMIQGKVGDAHTMALAAMRESLAKCYLVNSCRLQLARSCEARGELAAARTHLEQSLTDAEPPSSIAFCRFALAIFESRHGTPESASRHFATAVEYWRSPAVVADPARAANCERIARELVGASQWTMAESLLREAIEHRAATLGSRHLSVAELTMKLADVLQLLRRPLEAAPLYRDVADALRITVGDEHPDVGTCLYHLARIASASNDLPALRRLNDDALVLARAAAKLPPNHPHRSGTLLLQGLVEMSLGQADAAEPRLRECVKLRNEQLGPENRITVYAQTVLGGCLTRQGRFEEAEALLVEFVPRVEARYLPGSYMSIEARQRLVDLYLVWNKPELAQAAAEAAPPASAAPGSR